MAVTQRVVAVPSRNERRDVLDQAWVPFLAACGADVIVLPNCHPDPVTYLRRLGASAIVLTGGGGISSSMGTRDGRPAIVPNMGGDLAPERDLTETTLLHASIEESWPVIGVCRGMQAMNLFHGGRVAPLPGHAGTRHSLTQPHANSASRFHFDDAVNSSHDFGVPPDGVGDGMRVLAQADGWAEALVNDETHHLGIMWHPERNRPSSAHDIALFRRFLRGDA